MQARSGSQQRALVMMGDGSTAGASHPPAVFTIKQKGGGRSRARRRGGRAERARGPIAKSKRICGNSFCVVDFTATAKKGSLLRSYGWLHTRAYGSTTALSETLFFSFGLAVPSLLFISEIEIIYPI